MQRNAHYIFLLLFLFDIAYSFFQHFHLPLDGDIAPMVIPHIGYQKVLEDPFGLSVLLGNEVYAGTNRFFAHWSTANYFRYVPEVLQNFLSPVDSVYTACAFAKTFIQVSIISIIAIYIVGMKRSSGKNLLLAAILICPLFQTFGFNGSIGIMDKSISYTFFYAFPFSLLLLYFLPFFNAIYHEQSLNLNVVQKILLFLLAIVLSFSGPLIAPVVLIICPLVLLMITRREFYNNNPMPFFQNVFISLNRIPKALLFYFILISILSMYSFYIGMNNSENSVDVPLGEKYFLLMEGLGLLLIKNPGLPLLIFMIAFNAGIICKLKRDQEGHRILIEMKYILIFAVIYILLLPLGGFRTYRPYILRYDTFMPVTLGLILIYGLSTYFLINYQYLKFQRFYLTGTCIFLLIFTMADGIKFQPHACERQALEDIAQSSEKVVLVKSDCPIMAWGIRENDEHTDLNGQLLQLWGITKEKKLYIQK